MRPRPEAEPETSSERCPFCHAAGSIVWQEDEAGLALWDGYPVSEGHTLVVPRRHVTSVYDLAPVEQRGMWQLVATVRERLRERFAPDAFTIGVNDGPAAGQTVGHAHIHVIPRRHGDVTDPRGGVRWVVPDKAAYWNEC